MLRVDDTPSPSPSPPPLLSHCERPTEVLPWVSSHDDNSPPIDTTKLCLNDAVSVPATVSVSGW
eukprot:2848452-Prorocentrum_lima.AAC.1